MLRRCVFLSSSRFVRRRVVSRRVFTHRNDFKYQASNRAAIAVRGATASGIAAIAAATLAPPDRDTAGCSGREVREDLERIDSWWEKEMPLAKDQLMKLNEEYPGNAEVLWRLTRVLYNIAFGIKDKHLKQSIYEDAMRYIEEALNDEEGKHISSVHKWYAIVLSELSSLQGTKASIESAYVVKDHFDRAAELDPSDPNCWHFLGRWSFTIASIGWWSRQIAATIFATPPMSTFEEALGYFDRAESIRPGFWKSNLFYIARCHFELGDKKRARSLLIEARSMDVITEEDRQTQTEIEALLATIPAAEAA